MSWFSERIPGYQTGELMWKKGNSRLEFYR